MFINVNIFHILILISILCECYWITIRLMITCHIIFRNIRRKICLNCNSRCIFQIVICIIGIFHLLYTTSAFIQCPHSTPAHSNEGSGSVISFTANTWPYFSLRVLVIPWKFTLFFSQQIVHFESVIFLTHYLNIFIFSSYLNEHIRQFEACRFTCFFKHSISSSFLLITNLGRCEFGSLSYRFYSRVWNSSLANRVIILSFFTM